MFIIISLIIISTIIQYKILKVLDAKTEVEDNGKH